MTRISSRILTALCAVAFTSIAFAETPDGFYDKEQVRGFISLKGDYRHMRSEGVDAINKIAFGESIVRKSGSALADYKTFDNDYVGLHVDLGAEYKQFLTWVDVDFMPVQKSERPADYTSGGYPLYDVTWNSYGANWMFGWKLLGADAPINLIPSVGIGFSLLNVHLGTNYLLVNEEDTTDVVTTRDRSYSTMGMSYNAELEARIQLGQFSLGGYGGYKMINYDAMKMEGFKVGNYDFSADTWFVGGKVTWTMLSPWQRKQRDRI